MHQYPELSNQEFQTTKFIKETLQSYGVKNLKLKSRTGAVALVNETKKFAVAIRADIDALPILEKTTVPFKSKNAGVMHACGHDMHAAIVMGTAVILNSIKKELPGCVKFIFQPAEEMPPGGAEVLIKEGVLKNPDVKMIFGHHVDPSLETGKIGLRDGPTMASVTDFDITIYGKGSHAAKPHLGVDAIAAAAELVNSMQKIVSREIDPLNPIVITFGIIEGGRARNIIADQVLLKGTARTLSPESLKQISKLIKRTTDGICHARGASYKLNILAEYPVLSNHASANRIYHDVYSAAFGKNKIAEVPQSMGGEDFAYYLQKIPGAMCRLGIKNKKFGSDKPWHSADFMSDEESIYYGTVLFCLSVLEYFSQYSR